MTRALGFLQDSEEVLSKALTYLATYRQGTKVRHRKRLNEIQWTRKPRKPKDVSDEEEKPLPETP